MYIVSSRAVPLQLLQSLKSPLFFQVSRRFMWCGAVQVQLLFHLCLLSYVPITSFISLYRHSFHIFCSFVQLFLLYLRYWFLRNVLSTFVLVRHYLLVVLHCGQRLLKTVTAWHYTQFFFCNSVICYCDIFPWVILVYWQLFTDYRSQRVLCFVILALL